jgi:hypothetical protein
MSKRSDDLKMRAEEEIQALRAARFEQKEQAKSEARAALATRMLLVAMAIFILVVHFVWPHSEALKVPFLIALLCLLVAAMER